MRTSSATSPRRRRKSDTQPTLASPFDEQLKADIRTGHRPDFAEAISNDLQVCGLGRLRRLCAGIKRQQLVEIDRDPLNAGPAFVLTSTEDARSPPIAPREARAMARLLYKCRPPNMSQRDSRRMQCYKIGLSARFKCQTITGRIWLRPIWIDGPSETKRTNSRGRPVGRQCSPACGRRRRAERAFRVDGKDVLVFDQEIWEKVERLSGLGSGIEYPERDALRRKDA